MRFFPDREPVPEISQPSFAGTGVMRRAIAAMSFFMIAVFLATNTFAATTVVRPDDLLATPALGGWWFVEDAPSSGNATGTLVQGPGIPPLAVGSARMVLDSGTAGRLLLGTADYNGTRLSDLTALEYSAYRASSDAGNLLAASLQINIDYDLTDASSGWQGRLVFEPYFTVGSGTILEDTWYDFDPLVGTAKWYQTANAVVGNVNVGNPCPQSSPCSLATIKATYPNAGIHVTLGALQLKAGAPWPSFDGNVDEVTVGVLGDETTFDFEAAKVCAAARYVDPAGSNSGNDCDDSGSPCLTVQYAIDQACSGETVNVAAGTYTEQVTIGQSLTLAGAGAASTVLLAPSAASRALVVADYGFGDRTYDYQLGVFGRNVDAAFAPDTVPDETQPRVNAGDAPPGFGPDSWQGPATGKSNWHARYLADGDYLSALFPAEAATLTLGDIASISYFTKRPSGTPAGRDWWIQIYTRWTGSGDASSWYHDRFISNYNEHTSVDAWTQYTTNGSMTFNLQTPVGPEQTLAQIQATEGSQLIEMISVQTDSGWNGFDGYIDGLVITLTNGKSARVSFDATSTDPEPDVVNVSGLTLDGNLDAKLTSETSRSCQIAFLNASGSITASTLADWQNAPNFGDQGIVSLLLGSAGPVSVSVEGNTISGYQKGAIAALGAGAMEVEISGNVIAGAGPTIVTAQNGIQINASVAATIENNQISGNNYTTADWCSAGILIDSSDGALVHGNDLAGNLCDILATTNGSTFSGNNIPSALTWPLSIMGDGNTVHQNYVNGSPGGAVYNDGINNTYTCNRISNNPGGGFYFDDYSTPGTPNAATDNAVYGNGTGMDATAIVTLPPIDARDNWWGCEAGAGSPDCDAAIGNLDATPSAASEPLCVTCAGGGGDSDLDMWCDPVDNCPLVSNVGQDNADADAAGDACDACPLDAANDADGDTICGSIDNCPNDANLDQADADEDGIGNVCDTDDAEGSLILSQISIKAANPDTGKAGHASIGALIVDSVGATLADDLAAGDVYVELAAGSFNTTMPLGTCVDNGHRIKCENDTAGVRALFSPVMQGNVGFPDTWKVRIKQRQVASDQEPTAPVTVVFVQPSASVSRADDISACEARPRKLRCRED